MKSFPIHDDFEVVDHRDDYRNGFIDAVLFTLGIQQATPAQIRDALETLRQFRLPASLHGARRSAAALVLVDG